MSEKKVDKDQLSDDEEIRDFEERMSKELEEWDKKYMAKLERERLGEEDEDDRVKKPVVPFKCPVCSSTHYTEHTKSNGIHGPGGRTWVTGYECTGCTATFRDPAKFSKNRRPTYEIPQGRFPPMTQEGNQRIRKALEWGVVSKRPQSKK